MTISINALHTHLNNVANQNAHLVFLPFHNLNHSAYVSLLVDGKGFPELGSIEDTQGNNGHLIFPDYELMVVFAKSAHDGVAIRDFINETISSCATGDLQEITDELGVDSVSLVSVVEYLKWDLTKRNNIGEAIRDTLCGEVVKQLAEISTPYGYQQHLRQVLLNNFSWSNNREASELIEAISSTAIEFNFYLQKRTPFGDVLEENTLELIMKALYRIYPDAMACTDVSSEADSKLEGLLAEFSVGDDDLSNHNIQLLELIEPLVIKLEKLLVSCTEQPPKSFSTNPAFIDFKSGWKNFKSDNIQDRLSALSFFLLFNGTVIARAHQSLRFSQALSDGEFDGLKSTSTSTSDSVDYVITLFNSYALTINEVCGQSTCAVPHIDFELAATYIRKQHDGFGQWSVLSIPTTDDKSISSFIDFAKTYCGFRYIDATDSEVLGDKLVSYDSVLNTIFFYAKDQVSLSDPSGETADILWAYNLFLRNARTQHFATRVGDIKTTGMVRTSFACAAQSELGAVSICSLKDMYFKRIVGAYPELGIPSMRDRSVLDNTNEDAAHWLSQSTGVSFIECSQLLATIASSLNEGTLLFPAGYSKAMQRHQKDTIGSITRLYENRITPECMKKMTDEFSSYLETANSDLESQATIVLEKNIDVITDFSKLVKGFASSEFIAHHDGRICSLMCSAADLEFAFTLGKHDQFIKILTNSVVRWAADATALDWCDELIIRSSKLRDDLETEKNMSNKRAYNIVFDMFINP
tara:strand:+ start:3864 stop:6125 length:2262 start_codon:yes stop_codon:yes gene_type:complete